MIFDNLMMFSNVILYIILPIVGLAIGLGCWLLYILIMKKKMGDAKELASKMLNDAIAEAKTMRKEAILESKEEVHKQRVEFDKEVRDRRNELSRSEQRIVQKEEALDRKEETLDKKIESLETAKLDLVKRNEEVDAEALTIADAKAKMMDELQKVAGLTREEAKKQLIEETVEEAKKDAAVLVRELEAEAKETAEKKSREILSLAIQRCAVDHSADITVSVVNLPNDDMKGRIIGREGRNIKALEQATGIDLIIDDTPEAVVLSGFDPVRREVARITLERLIADGRIHPARIEEMVTKVRKELDQQIKEAGEAAMFEAGVYNLHADIIRLLGRLKYRTSYGQNVLKHSLEVSHLAGMLAAELGADVALCRRAGLLHDIGKAVDHEVEGTHISIGADLAKKYKESKEVIHCIAAHHNDIEPNSVEAVLIQVADAISGARPGARRESLDNYVKRLEKLESICNEFTGVEKSFAIQAGREVRIIVKPDVVDDAATVFMAKDIASKIEKEMEYPGQIKVNVIREMRSVEYAK